MPFTDKPIRVRNKKTGLELNIPAGAFYTNQWEPVLATPNVNNNIQQIQREPVSVSREINNTVNQIQPITENISRPVNVINQIQNNRAESILQNEELRKRPLRPSEFNILRQELGVAENNFENFFQRKGKDIFIRPEILKNKKIKTRFDTGKELQKFLTGQEDILPVQTIGQLRDFLRNISASEYFRPKIIKNIFLAYHGRFPNEQELQVFSKLGEGNNAVNRGSLVFNKIVEGASNAGINIDLNTPINKFLGGEKEGINIEANNQGVKDLKTEAKKILQNEELRKRPLRPSEFNILRQGLGISENNFDDFFSRKGKDIFVKPDVLNIITGKEQKQINIPSDIVIDSEIFKQIHENPKTNEEIDKLINERNVLRNKILDLLKPSEEELKIQERLNKVRQQIDVLTQSFGEGLLTAEGRVIPMKSILGEQALLEKRFNLKLSTLQKAEANLLEELGLQKEIRQANINAIKQGLSFIQDDINLQFVLEDRLKAEEDRIEKKKELLTIEARKRLEDILNMIPNVEYSDLPDETKNEIEQIAKQAGIPLDVLIEGMKFNKLKTIANTLGLTEAGTFKPLSTSELIKQAINLVENGHYPDLNSAINAIKDIQEGRQIQIEIATADEIARAIKSVESGGNYEAKGVNGEIGAYQIMPENWSEWSAEYARAIGLGEQTLLPTPKNQDAVAKFKIQQLLNKGFSPSEIASIWNSGSPNPEGKIGVNKKGIPFNVPLYVERFNNALRGIKLSEKRAVNNDVERDVQSILQGTLDLNDLPIKNNYKAKVAAELAKKKQEFLDRNDFIGIMRSSAGGKDLDNATVKKLEDYQLILFQLENLSKLLKNQITDPIFGIITSNIPYFQKAALIQKILKGTVPKLARSVFGEVGVLSDFDVKMYSQTLPNLKDTKEVNQALLSYTVRMVQRGLENVIKTNAATGRDVSSPILIDIYKSIKEEADKLIEDIAPQLIDDNSIQVSTKALDYLKNNGL